MSQVVSNKDKDDSDLIIRKNNLVSDIVSLFSRVEIEESQNLRQKIRELAMVVEDIFLRNGQQDSIKYVFQTVCNLLLKSGLSDKYIDLSMKKEKSIRTYIYITLQDQERYFVRYNSSSHLSTVIDKRTEDSSTYFNTIMEQINETKKIDISLLDRRQIQEIMEAKTSSVIETERLAKSHQLPSTNVAEALEDISEKTVTIEREPEKKPDPYAEKITQEKPPEPRISIASQELDELVKDMQKFAIVFKEYSLYMYDEEIEKAYNAFRAFRIYFSQAHNKKIRKTFTQWTKMVKDVMVGGPALASKNSGLKKLADTPNPTEVNPATGEVDVKALSKEQIENRSLPILNAMVFIINHIPFFFEIENFIRNEVIPFKDQRATKLGPKLVYRRDLVEESKNKKG